MKNKPHHPPRWAQRFIEWYCKPELAEDLMGDLHEYFERNVKTKGPLRAKLIYIADAIKFFRSYTTQRPTFINTLINWLMLGNYIKTSARNLMRNKLFSTINVAGLAVSMSVGLLLIAFVLDLYSYDRFHENGKRIYRITNVVNSTRGTGKYATTSLKTGKLIRENVTGVEDVAIMRNDFNEDAVVGDNVIPIKAMWAEPSVFNIFTFPLHHGNPATALKDPYTVVLTETAAKKLFGNAPAHGKAVRFGNIDYQVTGVMKDVPFFSHINFEALVSLSTAEQINKTNRDFDDWTSMSSTYVYLLLSDDHDLTAIKSQLNAIAQQENRPGSTTTIALEPIPLFELVVGEEFQRSEGAAPSVGPHMSPRAIWILGGLALVVILSACFNYTNLSMARAMRRFKEVGLRKAIGAGKSQVRMQFLAEAILISFFALILSYPMFIVLRPQLISMAPEMQQTVKLELTPTMVATFILFSIAVGLIAGLMPATFFSKVNAINALRNTSPVKVFRRLTVRRTLVVIQYTVTLVFITATAVGYVQYKNILGFDLGFNTANILNIEMQDNKPDEFVRSLSEIPEVTGLSRSLIVTSVGNAWGGFVKYKNTRDSSLVLTNHVDENYLPLHEYQLVTGSNFRARPTTIQASSEIIVSEEVLKRFNIASNDPQKAIGEEIIFSNRQLHNHKLTIVGVVRDFHYGKVENVIEPVAFMYWTPGSRAVINAKIESRDILATMTKIEAAWKKIDPVHPFNAQFYEEAIEEAYQEYSTMIKIIGFLSLLAISIASMGLLGMVVFTTETRLKEIGIRRVMGASTSNVIYLLSRGFIILIAISATIALPATYLLFEGFVLTNFPYHTPVGAAELFAGLAAVLLIAFAMIGSQTVSASKINPASVLRSE